LTVKAMHDEMKKQVAKDLADEKINELEFRLRNIEITLFRKIMKEDNISTK
jgi:hypothetical protein